MKETDVALRHGQHKTTVLVPRDWCLSRWTRRVLDNPCRRLAYRFLAMMSVALFIMTTDTWAVGAALRTSLNHIVVRVESTFAPPPDDVTVVLWTDAALQGMQTEGIVERRWPVEYEAHAMLLNTLLEYRPKAIFLDFAFLTARADTGMDDFIDAVINVADAGIPLFIACIPGAGTPAFKELWDRVQEWEKPDKTDKTHKKPLVHFVPASIADETVVQTYPMTVHTTGQAGDCAVGPGPVLTVAPRMHNTLSHPDDARGSVGRITADAPTLSLIYDLRTAKATGVYFPKPGTAPACPSGPSGESRSPAAWSSATTNLIWGMLVDGEALRIPTAGPPMIPADAVIYEPPDLTKPDSNNICKRPMRVFLQDRVVMIGSNLAAAEDFRDTLFDRAQPGVLIHAAGYQNLNRYGDRYPRTELILPQGRGSVALSSNTFVLLFAIVLSALHAGFMGRRERLPDSRQLYLDQDIDDEGKARFLALRFFPTLTAFVFVMGILNVHTTEILLVALSLQILGSLLVNRVPNAVLVWLMYRKIETTDDDVCDPRNTPKDQNL